MEKASLIGYSAALTLALLTPGPVFASLLATGVARGLRPAVAFAFGVTVADAVLALVCLAGLTALALAYSWSFTILRYAGAAYLIWLGIRMWRNAATVGPAPPSASEEMRRAVGSGTAIGMGNPKAILFHASLLPVFFTLPALGAADYAAIIATVIVVDLIVLTLLARLAVWAGGLLRTRRRRQALNRASGAVLVGAGVTVAVRG